MVAGPVTIHVPDTVGGWPPRGCGSRRLFLDAGGRRQKAKAVTNHNGRTDRPILPQEAFSTGICEIAVDAGPAPSS